MYRHRYIWLIFCLAVLTPLQGFNRSLFFRTSGFWGEPRFVKPWLSTLDIQVLGGSNHRGRDSLGNRSNIFSIYGPENIIALSEGSPRKPLNLPGNPKKICFKAVTDVFEADFNWYQNFAYGFFTHFHFPAVVVRTCPSGFVEECPCCKRPPRKYDPAWEQSLNLLQPFLNQFDLSLARTNQAGPSDSTLFLGWAYSYEDTCYLDFIDTTLKTGALFPTGRKADLNQVFSIPYGYNGHWGVPLSWDISVGVFDWLTFGYHVDTVFFINKTRCLRMRTPEEDCTGFIVLGKGLAEVNQGTVWRMGTYIKADHFFYGLSLLLGFAYEQKNDDVISPCDTETFDPLQVNKDPRFKKWARSLALFLLEYDFAQEDSCVGTRVGLFYNLEMTGLRTFNISTGGGYLGLDVAWTF